MKQNIAIICHVGIGRTTLIHDIKKDVQVINEPEPILIKAGPRLDYLLSVKTFKCKGIKHQYRKQGEDWICECGKTLPLKNN